MINPLNELSDIYLGNISEADNSPEAIKGRVMQHVRAIRYRARKEGDQLTKAYNDYMAGQAGISATEKSMVKERLGLTGGSQHQEGMAYGLSKGTGKPSGPMAAFGKKKTKKTKPTVTIDKPDKLVSMKVMTPKESFDALVETGIFSDVELQGLLFDTFEESVEHRRNPEKYAEKPYREKSRAERMRDPERGINSPAFKKFMADRGMSV